MDKQIQTLKKCSASTDVEAATVPLQKDKRQLEDSETSVKLKKHKENDDDQKTTLKIEIEEIAKSIKDMSECVKILQENSVIKADLEDILLKVKVTPREKVEEIYECCFETKDAEGNNEFTIFVSGFSCSRSRKDVRSALIKHFDSCGEMTRVFVPIECKTGSPLGFAFINLREGTKKALTLDGSCMEEMKLKVTMAEGRGEYFYFMNFRGCERGGKNFYFANFRGCERCRQAPWLKDKRPLEYSETIVKLKKHKENDGDQKTTLKKEIEEIAKSMKDMSECVKVLQENSVTKADLERILLKVKETPKEKVEEIYECCFETKEAEGNNQFTIFVTGFRCSSRSRKDVKSILIKHFGKCGKFIRIFVPIECKTGSPLGFAFINLRKGRSAKALALDGSYLEEMKLTVTMAEGRPEYTSYPNFSGCERCHVILNKRRHERMVTSRLATWDPSKMKPYIRKLNK